MRSHHESEEVRLLRERIADLQARIDRRGDAASGSVVGVGVTYQIAAYPTAPNAWYALRPATVVGTETEGGSATPTPSPSGSILAYNLGTATPTPGTAVVVILCGDRYVFRYDG